MRGRRDSAFSVARTMLAAAALSTVAGCADCVPALFEPIDLAAAIENCQSGKVEKVLDRNRDDPEPVLTEPGIDLLVEAVQCWGPDVTRLLLEHGAGEIFGYQDALRKAMEIPNYEAAALLWVAEGELDWTEELDPLMEWAVRSDKAHELEVFLDAGASASGEMGDIFSTGMSGTGAATAHPYLLHTTAARNTATTALLLAAGADANRSSSLSAGELGSVIFLKPESPREDIVVILGPEIGIEQAVIDLVATDESTSALLNMDLGATVGPITPLWVAAALGDETLVRLLLDHGADPSIGVEPSGQTPIEAAQAMGYDEIVEMLGE